MTKQEAKRILMSDADFSGNGEKAKATADALCVAVEALEKQIPMKPMAVLGIFSGKEYQCGDCGNDIDNEPPCWQTYCPWCGRAIDWSDTE